MQCPGQGGDGERAAPWYVPPRVLPGAVSGTNDPHGTFGSDQVNAVRNAIWAAMLAVARGGPRSPYGDVNGPADNAGAPKPNTPPLECPNARCRQIQLAGSPVFAIGWGPLRGRWRAARRTWRTRRHGTRNWAWALLEPATGPVSPELDVDIYFAPRAASVVVPALGAVSLGQLEMGVGRAATGASSEPLRGPADTRPQKERSCTINRHRRPLKRSSAR